VDEAAALQSCEEPEELQAKLTLFWVNWDGKKMAETIRKLS
jgi:hypothetical protein